MFMTDLNEQCISSETIASGGMLTVKRDQVRLSNGHTSQREYVLHPGAVVVVPILPNGNVILEKQFRYPLIKCLSSYQLVKSMQVRIL
jgi:ADP-ribose pyrophosphatase